MSLLHASVTGNLRAAMDQQVRQVAGALRRAVATAGKQTQDDLRAQARGAGFRDGGRALANSWRLNVYPRPGVGATSFRPAALVTSKMPKAVEAFDAGKPIYAKGSRFLAIPSEVNARNGRGGRRLRVTTEQMAKTPGAFITKVKSRAGVFLWCLPLETRTTKRGRLRLFVSGDVEVFTGKIKGLQEVRRAKAAEGFVVMFLLVRKLNLRKRLNVAQVEARAPARFASAAQSELARVAR